MVTGGEFLSFPSLCSLMSRQTTGSTVSSLHFVSHPPSTCLPPLHVTSPVQPRLSFRSCLSINQPSAAVVTSRHHPFCLVTAPHALPHPIYSLTASPSLTLPSTIQPPSPLFSPSLISAPRAFSTSSESHTSWIIYLCAPVGDFAASWPFTIKYKEGSVL